MVTGMKIIQGKQAVVTQIRTRTAEQGKPAEAVCRGVSDPVYQKLHYNSVQTAAGRETVPVVLNGEPVDQQDGGVPVTASVSDAGATKPVIEERHLASIQKEMTLQELFQQEKE